ncbi:hypothetical protein LIER_30312 [Lithospermum erythrorhizon]|uniref:Uncharacterized protein n=1 Tax=Lithospermum erythrorhizon TaxID=34254 RepID=A0AAV3RQB2_LITER
MTKKAPVQELKKKRNRGGAIQKGAHDDRHGTTTDSTPLYQTLRCPGVTTSRYTVMAAAPPTPFPNYVPNFLSC